MNVNIEGQIRLYSNVDLDPNYDWTIDFETPEEQQSYFYTKYTDLVLESGYSFIRKDEDLKLDVNIDKLERVNYLSFKNNGRTYYAFIDDKRYVSDSTTAISYTIDVMQTFMFNEYEIKDSFVEREHQNRWIKPHTEYPDKKLKIQEKFNLVDENIDYGSEYVINKSLLHFNEIDSKERDYTFAYIFTKEPIHTQTTEGEWNLKENYMPTGYYVYVTAGGYGTQDNKRFTWKDPNGDIAPLSTPSEILKLAFLQNVKIQQIVFSKIPFTRLKYTVADPINYFEPFYADSTKAYNINFDINTRAIIIYDRETTKCLSDMYTVRNKLIDINDKPDHNNLKDIKYESKLDCFPYSFYNIIYGNNTIQLKKEYCGYEYFDSEVGEIYAPIGKIQAFQSLSSECTGVISIKDKNINITTNSGGDLNPQKLITSQIPNYLDLRTDSWETYLLNNKAQRTSGYVSAGVGGVVGAIGGVIGASLMGGGVMSGLAVGGALLGTGQRIASQIAKEKDIKNRPDDVRAFSGDTSLSMSISDMCPILCEMNVTPEYKNKLYNYFYHYGYSCKEFKIPNIRSRFYFNYIKTTNINIQSNIDSNFITSIKQIYNNGITIWHYRHGEWKGVNNYDYENAEMEIKEEY